MEWSQRMVLVDCQRDTGLAAEVLEFPGLCVVAPQWLLGEDATNTVAMPNDLTNDLNSRIWRNGNVDDFGLLVLQERLHRVMHSGNTVMPDDFTGVFGLLRGDSHRVEAYLLISRKVTIDQDKPTADTTDPYHPLPRQLGQNIKPHA